MGDRVVELQRIYEMLGFGEEYSILDRGEGLVGVEEIVPLTCCNTSRELIFHFFLMKHDF